MADTDPEDEGGDVQTPEDGLAVSGDAQTPDELLDDAPATVGQAESHQAEGGHVGLTHGEEGLKDVVRDLPVGQVGGDHRFGIALVFVIAHDSVSSAVAGLDLGMRNPRKVADAGLGIQLGEHGVGALVEHLRYR